MAEKSSDWKIRMEKYVQILCSLQEDGNPDLYSIEQNVIQYVSDVNPNSQLVGLQICEQLLKMQRQLNYQPLTKALLDKSFTGRPQNAQKATEIIKTCFSLSQEYVMQVLLEELGSKSPKIVSAVMSIFSDLAPTLQESAKQQIMQAIAPLLQNRSPTTRKEANDLNTKLQLPYTALGAATTPQSAPQKSSPPHSHVPSHPQPVSILKKRESISIDPPSQPSQPPASTSGLKSSQEVRKSTRKKSGIIGSASAQWNSFVSDENKKNLSSHKPMDVTAGIEGLMNQFNQDPSNSNCCAYGLFSSFVNRTFAPKVMNLLSSSILTFLKTDQKSLTDETFTAGTAFFIDKITDKRMEKDVFEIGDIICANITAPAFFQQLYPSMGAKNPALLSRMSNYFTHVLRTYGTNTGLDPNEISDQIKPLTGNPDPNVRKAANELVATLAQVYGEAILDGFSWLKKAQMDDIMKIINTNPLTDFIPLAIENREVAAPPVSVAKSQAEAPASHRPVSSKAEPAKLPKRNSLKPRPRPDFNVDVPPVAEDYNPAPRSVPTERRDENSFPQKMIDNLSQSRSAGEAKKAIEELDSQAGRILSSRGDGSMRYRDVADIMKSLGPWLNDSNSNVLFAICKLMERIFALLGNSIQQAPVSILSLLFNTLNVSNQRLRGAAMDMLNKLAEIDNRFVNEIFATAFRDLTNEGKSTAISFVMTVDFTPDVQSLVQLVADLITDQFEPESAEPFIEKFLEAGGKEELKRLAKKMTPAKRSLIMRAIHEEDSLSIFVDINNIRVSPISIENSLISKCFNDGNSSGIEQSVELQWRSLFNLRLTHTTMDTFKVESAAVLGQIKKGTPDPASYSDLIIAWCLINRKLGINEFFASLISSLKLANARLNQASLQMAVPLALSISIDLALEILSISEREEIFVEVLQTTSEIITNNEIITNLFQILKSVPLGPEAKSFFEQKSQKLLSETDDENLKQAIGNVQIKSNVVIEMSDDLRERMESSTLQIYEWIHQLSSPDITSIIAALKAISKQLDVDATVFNNHLSALVLAIIAKVHVFFAAEPPPGRLFKYIAYCIFSLLDKTDLPTVISPAVVKQLILEVITRLCNGVEDQMSNQSLNFLLLKMMDTCTSMTFKSLLDALLLCVDGQFPERWIKIALKCFETCLQNITQEETPKANREEEIAVCVIEAENVFKKTGYKTLKETELGQRVIQGLKKFITSVREQYPGILERPDVVKSLGQRSIILSL